MTPTVSSRRRAASTTRRHTCRTGDWSSWARRTPVCSVSGPLLSVSTLSDPSERNLSLRGRPAHPGEPGIGAPSAPHVDPRPPAGVRFDLADDLPHDGRSVPAAQQQIPEQVPQWIAFGPLEVGVRPYPRGV